jgi:transposase InsO family protein
VVNNKRIHRLRRTEGLRVPYRKKTRPLRGIGVAVGAFCPIRPNVVWALDFQFDQTSDARMLKLLNVIDEYTRECLAIDVARSIDADAVVACLERLAQERGAPAYVRFDHGPEFIAYAMTDWCRFNHTNTVFIDPGSPWQNAWIELQRAPARRVLERPAVRLTARSPSAPRGLADRLQHQPAPQRTRLAHAGRVRGSLAQPTAATTDIVRGSSIGIPSGLRRLFCEPNACNVGPNRTLLRAGFSYLFSHETTPGPINFPQVTTRWVLEGPLDP